MDIINSVPLLAAFGGLVSTVRNSVYNKKRGLEHAIDIICGVSAAVAVAEYITPVDSPKLAIIVGIIAGSLAGNFLDAVYAIAPSFAPNVIETFLERFGYTKDKDKT